MRVIYRGEPNCECIGLLEVFRIRQGPFEHQAVIECDCGQTWEFRVQADGRKYWWINIDVPNHLKVKFWVQDQLAITA